MKETLDEQSRKDLIQYRLARAHETLQEATLMADNMHFNAAMNRLYYACYYAIVSLLLKSDIPATPMQG